MASLGACPFEIVGQVLESDVLTVQDLSSLCLVSKWLRTIVEPQLYSKIEWKWQKDITPPIIPLLRTLVRRPELSTHVQTLAFDGKGFFPGRDESYLCPKIPVSDAELHDLVACIERMAVPMGNLWIEELRSGTMDALIALLLSQLSSLRHLHMGENFARESHLFGAMLRHALCATQDYGLPKFQHLQHVTFHHYSYGRRDVSIRDTADVLPLFYLPAVQSISTVMDNPIALQWPSSKPTPSTLTTLELKHIREPHLGSILSVTTGLKKLRWEWYNHPDIEDGFNIPVIDFDLIGAAIFQVRHTLTDLRLEAEAEMGYHDIEYQPLEMRGTLKSLLRCDKLERLEIPIIFISGLSLDKTKQMKDVLPRSIQHLTLTDDLWFQLDWEWEDADHLRMIRSWLESWRVSNPHLREFAFQLNFLDDGWNKTIRNLLERLCLEAGIEIKITKVERDVGDWDGYLERQGLHLL